MPSRDQEQAGNRRRRLPQERIFWTSDQVAELLGVPVKSLYRWNYMGDGPRVYRIGRHLRYHRDDLEAWLAGHQTDNRAS